MLAPVYGLRRVFAANAGPKAPRSDAASCGIIVSVMSDILPPNLSRRRNHIAVCATAPEIAFHLPPRFCVGEVMVEPSVLDEISLRRISTPSALEVLPE